MPTAIAPMPGQKPSECTTRPPKTAQVRIIGKPSHTAATDAVRRRAWGGTGSDSYSENAGRSAGSGGAGSA